jgi:endonuclease YncB( thermonuclease family)
MNRLFLSIVAFLILIPTLSVAKEPLRVIEGTVVTVTDGDGINVQDSLGTKVKVRLYGIDAPETEKINRKTGKISKPGQPYGEESFQALKSKVYRKNVKLDVMDIDKYRRLVCIVYLNDRVINKEMIAEGWSWAFRRYLAAPYSSEYISLEDQARSTRLGLWQQNNPQPPWEFRKMIKNRNE